MSNPATPPFAAGRRGPRLSMQFTEAELVTLRTALRTVHRDTFAEIHRALYESRQPERISEALGQYGSLSNLRELIARVQTVLRYSGSPFDDDR
jgi:hypothetical protein